MRRSLVITLLLLAAASPAQAREIGIDTSPWQRPGTNTLITANSQGEAGEKGSSRAEVTPDTQYAVFSSYSNSFSPGLADEFGFEDIYVRDLRAGITERLDIMGDGKQIPDAPAYLPSITPDGRYVAFQSPSHKLAGKPSDTGIVYDQIYVLDRQTGERDWITKGIDGQPGSNFSWFAKLSDDGRYVAFESASTNLVPNDTNKAYDVFLFDRQTREMRRITAPDGTQGNIAAQSAAMTADGRWIAFTSNSSNLVEGDTNATADVFVWSRDTGDIERVSVSSDEEQGTLTSNSKPSAISDDGRYVAFESWAPNLVPYDTNGMLDSADKYVDYNGDGNDVFVRDRVKGATERVSVTSAGEEMSSAAFPAMSDDGRFVAFHADKPGEDPADGDRSQHVYLHDRVNGSTEILSVADDRKPAYGDSEQPTISGDGRQTAFVTDSADITHDGNGRADAALRDRGPVMGVLGMRVREDGTQRQVEGDVAYSGIDVMKADDPADDAGDGPAGAELTGARVIMRAEDADLLARISVADLPTADPEGTPPTSNAYALEMNVGDIRFQLRAQPTGSSGKPEFWRVWCQETCGPGFSGNLQMSGGFGTTGKEIWIEIPMGQIALDNYDEISDVRVVAGPMNPATGEIVVADEIALEPFEPEGTRVEVGYAKAGTPVEDVPFEITRSGFAGFVWEFDAAGTADPIDLWARACWFDTCSEPMRRRLGETTPDPDPTPTPTPDATVTPTPEASVTPTPTPTPDGPVDPPAGRDAPVVQAGPIKPDATSCGQPGVICGTDAADVLIGTPDDDVILAFGGDDVIDSGSGDDVIVAGDGDDRVVGGLGRDSLRGGAGDDRLTGGEGADLLRGDGGADRLLGGLGRDRLLGGLGADVLDGGSGGDRCAGGLGPDLTRRCP